MTIERVVVMEKRRTPKASADLVGLRRMMNAMRKVLIH